MQAEFLFADAGEPDLRKRLTGFFTSETYRTRSAKTDSIKLANLSKVWKAGLNVAVGTDAGNPGTFHGTSFIDEVRAMQAAGLAYLAAKRPSDAEDVFERLVARQPGAAMPRLLLARAQTALAAKFRLVRYAINESR